MSSMLLAMETLFPILVILPLPKGDPVSGSEQTPCAQAAERIPVQNNNYVKIEMEETSITTIIH